MAKVGLALGLLVAGLSQVGCGRNGAESVRGGSQRNELGAFDPPSTLSNAECAYGTEGCPCQPGGRCAAGLSCWTNSCYGQRVRKPDTYMYKAQQFADVDRIREQVLNTIGLRAGMRIADLGAGQGFHTLAAAREVGANGLVVATDIRAEAIDALRGALKEAEKSGEKLAPVRLRLVERGFDTGLAGVPDGSLDVVLMVHVLSLSQDPPERARLATYFSGVARKLKPGGRFIFAHDWLRPDQLDRAQAARFFAGAGFHGTPTFLPMPKGMPAETFEEERPGGQRLRLRRGYTVVLRR